MDRRVFVAAFAALALAVALPAAVPSFAEAPAPDVMRAPDDPCFWQSIAWDDMSEAEQGIWRILGWSPETWDSTDENDYPASEFKTFDELSPEERDAVQALGYTQDTWDNIGDYCDDSSD